MVQTCRKHNLAIHDQYVKVFPDVLETIEHLYKRNIHISVVSAKIRTGAELGLELTGLIDYFQTIVAVDHVTHARPDPEAVITRMEALHGKAYSTLMVGDNYHDIEAGKNAGVQTAGVNWSEKGAAYLQQFKPTYMLDSMSDLLQLVK